MPTQHEREEANKQSLRYTESWRRHALICERCRPIMTEMRRDMAYLEERVEKLEPETRALRSRVRELQTMLENTRRDRGVSMNGRL